MKQILFDYTQYNVWANAVVIDLLKHLTDAELDEELGGSFGSVRNTLYHIWGAESIWMQRLQMAEQVILPQVHFKGAFAEACREWQAISKQFVIFVEKQFDDRGFEHELVYHTLKREPMKSKVYEVVQHCMNHSTFHRGQLIHYARLLGINKIPSTDFITYSRQKKS